MKRTPTWVKICGTTSLHDAQLCVEAGADALGFVFAPSPRRVEVSAAADIVREVAEAECIGVFVNESPERIAAIAGQVGLSAVQLQGDESADDVIELRRRLGQRKIIKAIRARDLLEPSVLGPEEVCTRYDCADAILLDSGSVRQRGGTGVPFDWQAAVPVADRIRERMPLIVAGGLNADNVGTAIELFQPWGVDVVSAVESAPGTKDENKLREFIAAVRQAD
jgi:phosphoribosylanthranilate isomerase